VKRQSAVGKLAVMVVAALLAAPGCVQRNVESISSDEAAAIPAPPAPQAAGQPSAGGATDAATTRISGVIEVEPSLAGDIPANGRLYLIVRVAGREGGAPLAVQQQPLPSFPYAFEITERDSMIEGTPLIGEMSITARIDQDGDAFTATPGDLAGEISPVVAGDSDVVLRIDERVAGDGGR